MVILKEYIRHNRW